MRHKHADLIHAYAEGAEIQLLVGGDQWITTKCPQWDDRRDYRIKPTPKPDVVRYANVYLEAEWCAHESLTAAIQGSAGYINGRIRATFDGDTGKLKSAEVL